MLGSNLIRIHAPETLNMPKKTINLKELQQLEKKLN